MSTFDDVFRSVIGEEGGYTANAADPGNWTSGKCGVGRCSGTKYGISAASYPNVDIAGLSLNDAKAIYRRDYWDKVRGDELPAALALLVFDAAVNSGPSRAIRWLQTALRVTVDGVLGPASMAAVQKAAGQGAALLAEYQAQRLVFMASLPTWRTFALGWSRRVCTMQYEALRVGGGS